MEDAHSAVIGIPDQKENVSWFAGGTKSSISFSYQSGREFLISATTNFLFSPPPFENPMHSG